MSLKKKQSLIYVTLFTSDAEEEQYLLSKQQDLTERK